MFSLIKIYFRRTRQSFYDENPNASFQSKQIDFSSKPGTYMYVPYIYVQYKQYLHLIECKNVFKILLFFYLFFASYL